MGVEVIQDHMNLFPWMVLYNAVHKVEKFPSSPTIVMAGLNLAGGYIERCKKRCCAVSFIPMRLTEQSSSVWKFEITLRSFQCLDLGFLINRDYQSIFRGIQEIPTMSAALAANCGLVEIHQLCIR